MFPIYPSNEVRLLESIFFINIFKLNIYIYIYITFFDKIIFKSNVLNIRLNIFSNICEN